jgi:Ca-activated chloride channel homolog
MRKFARLCCTSAALGLAAPAGMALGAERVTFLVFDASGSMWAQLEDGKSRIEVAREVIDQYAATRDAEAPIGVVAYGHNRRGDCGDIEALLPLGRHSAETLGATIRALNPRGMTPLTDSMAMARDMIPPTAEAADIILVTDGLENCGGDPCALAAEMAAEGIDIRAHVVGFALEEEAVLSLSCVPEQTGGQLFITNSGAELTEALAVVSAPDPQPETVTLRALDARDMSALAHATWAVTDAGGATVFEGTQRGIIDIEVMPGNYLADVSAPSFEGAAEFEVAEGMDGPVDVLMAKVLATLMLRGEAADTGETLDGIEWTLLDVASETAEIHLNEGGGYYPVHVEPGEYRIEGVRDDLSGAAMATATREADQHLDILLAAPEPEIAVTIEAPDEVNIGAAFEVVLSGTASSNDYMVLVPAGSDESVSRYGRMSSRVGGDGPREMSAPSHPGTYELRYYLDADHSLVARATLEVVDVEITLEAPAQVEAGSTFEIAIGGGVPGHVVIVEPDRAEDDIVSRYQRMSNSVNGDEGTISRTAPDEPGQYSLRYHSSGEHRLLASQPLEVTEAIAEASLEAPDEVGAGATIDIAWTGPDDRQDYITVVEPGAPEGTFNAYQRTSRGSPVSLQMPDALGAHELRYVHQQSGRTLASRTITLTPVSASLEAPEEALAGSTIEVHWDGPDNRQDYITVVEPGAPEGSYEAYQRTSRGSPVSLQMPDALGAHELRYVVAQSGRTLASRPITLVATAASLEAPEEALAGSTIEVHWEGPDNRQDYITVVEPGAPEALAGSTIEVHWEGPDNRQDYITVVEPGAPEGSYEAYQRTSRGSPVSLQMPDALGAHELRYVVRAAALSGRTLASRPITLVATAASLEAPEEALAGSTIEVHWEGPDNRQDYITVVEPGAPEGSYEAYQRTSRGSPVSLQMPDALGAHELRYVVAQSGRTLASRPITLVATAGSVSAPAEIPAGSNFDVSPGRVPTTIRTMSPSSRSARPKAATTTISGPRAAIR